MVTSQEQIEMVSEKPKTGMLMTEKGELKIVMHCRECSGTGREAVKLGVKDLVDIYEKSPANKIERIKELRAKTYLGLKPAKEVIEAYDQLISNLRAIRYR
tara:strand:- start:206 stop:508 length:303 start_codon:yes stop_codon:yes gene_type:complete